MLIYINTLRKEHVNRIPESIMSFAYRNKFTAAECFCNPISNTSIHGKIFDSGGVVPNFCRNMNFFAGLVMHHIHKAYEIWNVWTKAMGGG